MQVARQILRGVESVQPTDQFMQDLSLLIMLSDPSAHAIGVEVDASTGERLYRVHGTRPDETSAAWTSGTFGVSRTQHGPCAIETAIDYIMRTTPDPADTLVLAAVLYIFTTPSVRSFEKIDFDGQDRITVNGQQTRLAEIRDFAIKHRRKTRRSISSFVKAWEAADEVVTLEEAEQLHRELLALEAR